LRSLYFSDPTVITEVISFFWHSNNILENSQKASELKIEFEKKNQELKNKEAVIIENAKEKASNILIEAKEDANEIIKNIEKSKSSKDANNYRNKLNKKINDLSETKASSSPITFLTKNDIKLNMKVFVPKLNQNGTIISINGDSVMLQIGIIKTAFKINELSPAQESTPTKNENIRSIKREFKPQAISPEINVLGQNVDEACFVIDKYLDTCSLNGLLQIRIVHGKGTGALRKGIHTFLKSHPHVKSFRLGTFGEGEMGVTVVELK